PRVQPRSARPSRARKGSSTASHWRDSSKKQPPRMRWSASLLYPYLLPHSFHHRQCDGNCCCFCAERLLVRGVRGRAIPINQNRVLSASRTEPSSSRCLDPPDIEILPTVG